MDSPALQQIRYSGTRTSTRRNNPWYKFLSALTLLLYSTRTVLRLLLRDLQREYGSDHDGQLCTNLDKQETRPSSLNCVIVAEAKFAV